MRRGQASGMLVDSCLPAQWFHSEPLESRFLPFLEGTPVLGEGQQKRRGPEFVEGMLGGSQGLAFRETWEKAIKLLY